MTAAPTRRLGRTGDISGRSMQVRGVPAPREAVAAEQHRADRRREKWLAKRAVLRRAENAGDYAELLQMLGLTREPTRADLKTLKRVREATRKRLVKTWERLRAGARRAA